MRSNYDASSIRVGVAITTFDRVDDARCCLEILRSVWQPGPFTELPVVHAYNGGPDWYMPQLEDRFIRMDPGASHYRGAAQLLDAALLALADQSVDYAVAMAGDVWAYDPGWVATVIAEMARSQLRLATASWRISPDAHGLRRDTEPAMLPMDGLATDFFIVDLPWALKNHMLPLQYGDFLDRNRALLNYFQESPFLERYLAGQFLGAVRAELDKKPGKDAWGSTGPRRARQLLRLMHERTLDPKGGTAPAHQGHWPGIGLLTTHNPRLKKAVVAEHPEFAGPTLHRLADADDLTWYNLHRMSQ